MALELSRTNPAESDAAPSPALAAYEATAPFYDAFTADHDYELWLGNLLPCLEELGLRHGRLLDVACGTGKSFLPMLERGWGVEAIDLSPAMLEIAAEKAAGRASLRLAEMRRLPKLGQFDLVWCLDDAVNYLLTGQELEDTMRSLARQLAPRGLCLFDCNTITAYRGFWSEEHRVPGAAGGELIWEGRSEADARPGTRMQALLSSVDALGRTQAQALHQERHHPPAEVLAAIEAASMECLQVFGHGYDAVLEQPLDEERHTKAIYIARPREGR